MATYLGESEYHERPPDGSVGGGVHAKRTQTGTLKTDVGNSQFYSKFGITIQDPNQPPHYDPRTSGPVNFHPAGGFTAPPPGPDHRRKGSSSSTHSTASRSGVVIRRMSGITDDARGSKFPKLEDCAHFHYDFVDLGQIQISLSDDNQENLFLRDSLSSSPPQPHFHITVTSKDRTWMVRRSYENLRGFDRQLHRCIFDRKFSQLPELRRNELTEDGVPAMKKLLVIYLNRLSAIAGNMINCGPILSWLEMDNRGNRLVASDDSAINTPAVGAAHVTKRYIKQATDEISLEVGDMLSIIDMPPGAESVWWRGKKGFEVGFFLAECVEMIGEKLPQSVASKLPESRPKPVLRRRGKLISLLRNFFSSRPARTQLKRTGIVKERVFGCDLGEHLLNSERQIPVVLECCTATIEAHGIVDGIYRLSGVASNIQKLRNEFDEEKQPNLTAECYLQDIHSISSLLKAYFRDLPNPLFTFQLYDKFIMAIQDEENKLMKIHDVIQQLPPPHYRTAKYLMAHLSRVAEYGVQTGMHCKNLAIVWAPNLLRSKDLEMACSTAALQGVGIQAIVTEYLIAHAEVIFSDQLQNVANSGSAQSTDGSLRRGRPKSLALSTPTKLLSLEDARAIINPSTSPKQKYIEVGGGPASLPEKYHTVIDLPGKQSRRRKDRKSPVPMTGWRAIFSKKSIPGGPSKDRLSGGERPGGGDSEDYGEDYDEEDGRRRRLRVARSADSLICEAPVRAMSNMNRFSDTTSDGSAHVSPYGEEFRPGAVTSLDRSHSNSRKVKATKRSISADNSYSEGEMDGVSPEPGGPVPSSPRGSLLSELENRLRGRSSVSTSPNHDHNHSPVDGLGSLPILNQPSAETGGQLSRPKSQMVCGTESIVQQQPKRSKSTALNDQTEFYHGQLPPVPPPRQLKGQGQGQQQKVKVTSPGKRKKAKAPLPPPAAPPRKQTIEESATVEFCESPKVHRIEDSQLKSRSVEDLIEDLTESPGARRKLLYSAPSELETHGLEGAPGEMAAETTLTDDEAFNTQNLSLTTTTDSDCDAAERREGMSHMDGLSQDDGGCQEVPCEEQEGGQEGLVYCDEVSDVLVDDEGTREEMVHLHDGGDQVRMAHSQELEYKLYAKTYSDNSHQPVSASDFDIYKSGANQNPPFCPPRGESQSGLDESGVLSKSLSSVLTGAAAGTRYYSSDEMSQQGTRLSCFDSNSDSQFSGATMSTNFTSSSEIPCVSTSDESEFASAKDYADSLRSESAQLLRKSLVSYSTSESDISCGGTGLLSATPQLDAEFTFSPSDTDTEVAKTPDHLHIHEGDYDSDRQTPRVAELLSDAEVTFVDPVASSDFRTPVEEDFPPPPPPLESCESEYKTPMAGEYSATDNDVFLTPAVALFESHFNAVESEVTKNIERALTQHALSESQQVVAPRPGDGYMADRSCSASPTAFTETNVAGEKAVFKAQDNSEPELNVIPEVSSPLAPPVVLESNQSHSFPDEQLLIDQAACQEKHGVKKSAESLLFELEDLDTNLQVQQRHPQGSSVQGSRDKLNMSSDEVFYRPQSLDELRTEVNMSVSPDNYLDNTEAKPLERDSSDSMESLSHHRHSADGVTVKPAKVHDKKSKDLTRKKSVRELMSKFESSSAQSESSDDAANLAKMSASVDSISDSNATADYKQKTMSLPRKPSSRITSKIRSLQEVPDSVSSSDDCLSNITEQKPMKDLHTQPESPVVITKSSHPVQSSLPANNNPVKSSAAINISSSPTSSVAMTTSTSSLHPRDSAESTDESSTSPRISDIKRQFEEQQTQQNQPQNQEHCQNDSSGSESPSKSRTSLSERLQSLSNKFKDFEELGEDKSPPRRSTSKAGQFVTRAASKSEARVITGEAESEAELARLAKLRERRQRFETVESRTSSTSSVFEDAKAPSEVSKPKMFTPPEVVSQTETAEPALTQPTDVEVRMSPRTQRRTERRRRKEKEDNPVSVRDLSRQFERQLSDKSDVSGSSAKSTSWNCANDVANGNNIIQAATPDVVPSRNVTQQQKWTTML